MLQKERDPEIKALVMILLGGTSESICKPVWMASAVTSRKYFALQIGANRFITRQAWTLQVSLGLFLCIVCKDMVVLLQKPMSKYLEQAFKDKRNFWKHTFDFRIPYKNVNSIHIFLGSLSLDTFLSDPPELYQLKRMDAVVLCSVKFQFLLCGGLNQITKEFWKTVRLFLFY